MVVLLTWDLTRWLKASWISLPPPNWSVGKASPFSHICLVTTWRNRHLHMQFTYDSLRYSSIADIVLGHVLYMGYSGEQDNKATTDMKHSLHLLSKNKQNYIKIQVKKWWVLCWVIKLFPTSSQGTYLHWQVRGRFLIGSQVRTVMRIYTSTIQRLHSRHKEQAPQIPKL